MGFLTKPRSCICILLKLCRWKDLNFQVLRVCSCYLLFNRISYIYITSIVIILIFDICRNSNNQVPVILNLRDMWTITGHCAYPVGCERWKNGCGHCPDLNIYPKIARDATKYNYQRKKDIYNNCRLYLTTPTKWLMDQVCDSHMFNAIEYRVIANAIDTTVFVPGNRSLARQKLNFPEDAKIILFFAHTEFKDVKTMKTALSLLRKGNVPLIFICIRVNRKTGTIRGRRSYIYRKNNRRKHDGSILPSFGCFYSCCSS